MQFFLHVYMKKHFCGKWVDPPPFYVLPKTIWLVIFTILQYGFLMRTKYGLIERVRDAVSDSKRC